MTTALTSTADSIPSLAQVYLQVIFITKRVSNTNITWHMNFHHTCELNKHALLFISLMHQRSLLWINTMNLEGVLLCFLVILFVYVPFTGLKKKYIYEDNVINRRRKTPGQGHNFYTIIFSSFFCQFWYANHFSFIYLTFFRMFLQSKIDHKTIKIWFFCKNK